MTVEIAGHNWNFRSVPLQLAAAGRRWPYLIDPAARTILVSLADADAATIADRAASAVAHAAAIASAPPAGPVPIRDQSRHPLVRLNGYVVRLSYPPRLDPQHQFRLVV